MAKTDANAKLNVDGFVHTLESENISIGRDSDNTIVLSNDSVSGRHAEIILSTTSASLRDLGSTNGTKLNGYLIQEAELHHGDLVCFGELESTFLSSTALTGAKSDPAKELQAVSPSDLAPAIPSAHRPRFRVMLWSAAAFTLLVVAVLMAVPKSPAPQSASSSLRNEKKAGRAVRPLMQPSLAPDSGTTGQSVEPVPANAKDTLAAIAALLRETYPEIVISSKPGGTFYFHLGSKEKKNHVFRCYMPKLDPYRILIDRSTEPATLSIGTRDPQASHEYWELEDGRSASRPLPLTLSISAEGSLRRLFRNLIQRHYDPADDEPPNSSPKLPVSKGLTYTGLGLSAASILEQVYEQNIPYYWQRWSGIPQGYFIHHPFNPTLQLCGPADDLIEINCVTELSMRAPKATTETFLKRHFELADAVDPEMALWAREQIQTAFSSGIMAFAKKHEVSPNVRYAVTCQHDPSRGVRLTTSLFGVKEH